MLFVQVCVGSSCHLKGSHDIVELLEAAVEEHHLDDEVVLSGSFCIGKHYLVIKMMFLHGCFKQLNNIMRAFQVA